MNLTGRMKIPTRLHEQQCGYEGGDRLLPTPWGWDCDFSVILKLYNSYNL